MVIQICDFCYLQDGKVNRTSRRIGHTHSIKVHVCPMHEAVLRQAKTKNEFYNIVKKFMDLGEKQGRTIYEG